MTGKESMESMKRYEFCPGNGGRYDILLGLDSEAGLWLLCWMLRAGSGGSCMILRAGGFLHWSYIMEKLNSNRMADIAALLAFIDQNTDVSVGMPEDFNEKGLFVPPAETSDKDAPQV